MKEIKNSIGMFDLFKGTVLILIVFFHTNGLFAIDTIEVGFTCFTAKEIFLKIPVVILGSVYYLFAGTLLPTFFVISGYGIKKASNSFTKQIRRLIIPYFMVGSIATVLHFIMHCILYRYPIGAFRETGKVILGFCFGLSKTCSLDKITIFSCGPAWFLLTYCFSWMIFNFLLRYYEKRLIILVTVITIIGWGLSFVRIVPWCISQSFVAVIYLFFGYFIRKQAIFQKGLSKSIIFTMLFLVVIPLFSLILQ